MPLIQKLRADSLEARKSGNKIVASSLVTLISEIQGQGKTEQERLDPSDDTVIAVIKKFIKNLDETIRISGPGEFSKNTIERDILETYLPHQLTESEIQVIITGLKNPDLDGRIMGTDMKSIMEYFKKMYPGQYDGALVAKYAR